MFKQETGSTPKSDANYLKSPEHGLDINLEKI